MFGEGVILLWSVVVAAALIRQWRSGDLAEESGERMGQQPMPAPAPTDPQVERR